MARFMLSPTRDTHPGFEEDTPVSHVLIVEDQVPVGRLLRTWIEAEGASVVTATSAEQALLLASEHTPAVALCDIRLPGGRDGFWLVEQLRLLHPETAVVMTTGLPQFETEVNGTREGVADFVVKPFTRERIVTALRRGLAEHRSRKASMATDLERHAPEGQWDGAMGTTAALLTVLRAQGRTVAHHAERVSHLAVTLARALNVDEPELSRIEHATLLRDVERLDIYGIMRSLPHLDAAGAIAVASQEHFDGTGFPLGLKGDAIPRGARIVAVADAYDDLVEGMGLSGLTAAHAVETLCGERASQFDPAVLGALRAVQPDLQTSAA